MFVISHSPLTSNLNDLIEINKNKILEIASNILKICETPKTLETILQEIFTLYNLNMNINQYVLIGSTIKAYLTYLYENEKITYFFKDNKMFFAKNI